MNLSLAEILNWSSRDSRGGEKIMEEMVCLHS